MFLETLFASSMITKLMLCSPQQGQGQGLAALIWRCFSLCNFLAHFSRVWKRKGVKFTGVYISFQKNFCSLLGSVRGVISRWISSVLQHVAVLHELLGL